MGIFKNIKNFVTGGAADVELVIENPILNDGDPLKISVNVKPTGENIHPKRVYLQVMALEQSSTRNTLYTKEYVLDENIQINSGERKEWSHVVELPPEVPATVIAKHFRVEWGIKASIDMSGTDPSSGWQPFVLNKAMTFDVEQ